MANGEDWLWRPVLRGVCKAETLDDPNVRIDFIADANEALDCVDENDFRVTEAVRK